MAYSRRDFLKAGALAGLASVVPTGAFAGSPPVSAASRSTIAKIGADNLSNLGKASFQARIGAAFALSKRSKTGGLTLVEVSDAPAVYYGAASGRAKEMGECFSLTFHSFGDKPLPQQTYTLTDAQLGTFDLFIVPGSGEGKSFYYHAIVNRFCPA